MKTPRFLFLLFMFLAAFAFAEGTLCTHTYELQKGWNLIGIFLDPTEESVEELLSHPIYEFTRQGNGGVFRQTSVITVGKSYWIRWDDDSEVLEVEGYSVENLVPRVNPDSLDGSYQLSEVVTLPAGSEITRTAPEVAGYAFTEWSVTGMTLPDVTARTIKFTMPENSVKLLPNYKKVYKYTLTVNGESSQKTAGESVTVTAKDKSGYVFTGWTCSGVSLDDDTAQTVTFTMPFCEVTLTANYKNKFNLTVDGESSQKTYGEKVSVTAPAKTGYTFSNWTVEGVSVSKTTANPITFTMPGNDVTLTSNYTANKYTLTVNGTSSQVPYGTTVTEDAPAKSGYEFTDWTVSGVTVDDKTANPISFTMPAKKVTLTANYKKSSSSGKTYMVVTLSTGAVRYTDTAPNLSSDTCRTTELWLRRIPKGTFTMGSPTYEWGRYSDETQHQVTLSEDFYIGVFEMTQSQYNLIYGSNPSGDTGATRPVECVSYNTIRGEETGAGWPSSYTVDSDSFLGKLRSKTGLVFDLPTEAQWEYACRAGTTTALNTGKDLTDKYEDSAMDAAGRYYYNTPDGKGGYDEHTKVGSYLPNNWGLYDMHGNVCEWCLDWYQSDLGSAAVTDPVGATSGSDRVVRGGCWIDDAQDCRSAYRIGYTSSANGDIGFRVAFVPSVQEDSYVLTVDGVEEFVCCGTVVSKTALAKSGYEFTSWTVNGVTVDDKTANPISFTMPANKVTLTANYKKSSSSDKTYMVVTLSTGAVRYTDTAPDLSSDTCRTTELWLRRIPAGTFTMGSPTDEVGRDSDETQHQVTLSEDFYIGVFEMTQRQYELITGSRPSYFSNNDCYTTRPVESVSYDDIRGSSTGAGWPSSHNVDSTSFLGKLRSKTGLSFDLPTEAQWEYACRAGTTTALNTGNNLTSTTQDSAMDEAGRYWYNGGSSYSSSRDTTAGTAKVGSYLPNAYGLYDMHGNVWEWCLDWYKEDLGSAAVTDPVGATSGSYRGGRGGSMGTNARSCRSASRSQGNPSDSNNHLGFRVVF